MYLDIFKNFFANTQEDKFYMLKGAGEVKFNLTNTYKKINDGIYIIGKNQETIKITNTTTIQVGLILNKYEEFWSSIEVKILNRRTSTHVS